MPRANRGESFLRPVTDAMAFTWRSWRAAGWRYFGYALTIAVTIGVFQGVGNAVFSFRLAWWRAFISDFLDYFLVSLWLVPALAVASAVRTRRLAQWLPYVIAAAVALAITFTLGHFVGLPLLYALIENPAQWPGLTTPDLVGIWVNLPPIVLLTYLATFGYMYWHEAQRRAASLRDVQLERAQLSRRSYEARLRAMQARIDPQFLFDTLRDIQSFYETDAPTAEHALDDLVAYLRASLPSVEDAHASVGGELALVRAWLGIVAARTQGRLRFTVGEPPRGGDAQLPPMLLLPLVAHAADSVACSTRALESIDVTARIADGRISIAISDTAGAFAASAISEVAATVRTRMESVYGDAAILRLETLASGSRATIDVPLETDASGTSSSGLEAA